MVLAPSAQYNSVKLEFWNRLFTGDVCYNRLCLGMGLAPRFDLCSNQTRGIVLEPLYAKKRRNPNFS
jgi:hypothetical protein